MVEEKLATSSSFVGGLTWRSYLACIYALLVFTPATILLSLVTIGTQLMGAIAYCSLLIFVEYARFTGKPLTRHEGIIIFNLSGLAAGGPFLGLVYREYFVHSDIATRFGLTDSIPRWYAPPIASPVWNQRTFLDPSWLLPTIVFVLSSTTSVLGAIFFASVGREIFIEGERLPFPLQTIDVSVVETLTKREREPMHIMMACTVLSMIYGALLYIVPLVGAAFGYPLTLLPIPWLDLTQNTERLVPGGGFGVATDAVLLAAGLVLPTRVVVSMFLGSLFRFVILNHSLVRFGWSSWATRWTPGMDLSMIWQQSTLYFWAGPTIGMGIAAGIAPLLLRPRLLAQTLKRIFTATSQTGLRISGPPFSRRFLFFFFVTGCVGPILFDLWLVPDFPIWVLILYEMALPFLFALITIRMLGITGQIWDPPYITQLAILMSGHPRVDGWFLGYSGALTFHPGTRWAQNFKLCQLTNTSLTSWIKSYFLCWPLALFLNFVYVYFFWQLAPIPSATYPAPAIQWPVTATFQALWITRPEQYFNVTHILYFFVGTLGLSLVTEGLRLPLSMLSAVVGVDIPVPITFTMLVGLIVGCAISRVKGENWFHKQKTTIAAGITMGEGLALVIGSAISLMARSTFIKPW